MHTKPVLMMLLAGSLTGCAMFGPNTPHADITVTSAQYLNPDINGNPSPIVVTIYQLKSPYSFKQANFDALASNSASVLGNDLIDQQTIEVRPGNNMSVTQPISPNTTYLGVVAAYRNINQAAWRSTVAVPAKAKSFSINLDLESQGLSVTTN